MQGQTTLSVAAIANGTVIDHIPAGQALNILRMLQLTQQKNPVTVGLNLSSGKLTYKDIIKIENKFLTQQEQDQIAIFAQEATLNTIENYKIVRKCQLVTPAVIIETLLCPNQNCITQAQTCERRFDVLHVKKNLLLRCQYCEKVFERHQLKECFA
jgi:aspartate carbamoyltransferase regulatory subunit